MQQQNNEFCRTVKLNLEHLTSVAFLEFVEGYTCLFQDATLDFHSPNIKVTLHSSVFYIRNKRELEFLSLFFVSNELQDHTNTFFAFQETPMKHLKKHHRS